MKKHILFYFLLPILTFCLGLSISLVIAQGTNVPPPINTSDEAQTKAGALTIGQNLTVNGSAWLGNFQANNLAIGYASGTFPSNRLRVGIKGGSIGADKYCDSSGTQCWTVTELLDKINSLQCGN